MSLNAYANLLIWPLEVLTDEKNENEGKQPSITIFLFKLYMIHSFISSNDIT